MSAPNNYDRIYQNPSDGQTFYGIDNPDDGTTFWYDENGNLDDVSPTPSDDLQEAWDSGYYGIDDI